METWMLVGIVLLLVVNLVQTVQLRKVEESRKKHTRIAAR